MRHHGVHCCSAPVDRRNEHLDEITERDDRNEITNDQLNGPEAVALEQQNSVYNHGAAIPYDYAVDSSERYYIYCAELMEYAFELASDGRVRVPRHRTSLRHLQRTPFLHEVGIYVPDVTTPQDTELDPRFDIVAEYVNIPKLRSVRLQNAAVTAMPDFNPVAPSWNQRPTASTKPGCGGGCCVAGGGATDGCESSARAQSATSTAHALKTMRVPAPREGRSAEILLIGPEYDCNLRISGGEIEERWNPQIC